MAVQINPTIERILASANRAVADEQLKNEWSLTLLEQAYEEAKAAGKDWLAQAISSRMDRIRGS